MFYDENINFIDGSKIHPLSLVLSCCNGAGGGDYYASNSYEVGCWINTSNCIRVSDELEKGYNESSLLFNEVSEKVDNIEIIIDYISENFKISDIKKLEQMKFSPALFLDDNEKKNIIERSIQNIKEKEIKLDNKAENIKQAIQDIKDLVSDYEEELEK